MIWVIFSLPVLGLALLPVLCVALLPGHGGGHCLLHVVAPLHRHRTTNWLVDGVAHLLGLVLGVGNGLGLALLSGHLLAVLLGHLLAHLSGLVPALLAGLIPALLVAVDIAALTLGDSLAFFLRDGVAGLLVPCGALLLVPGVTLLFLTVLLHRLLHSVALHLGHVPALLVVDGLAAGDSAERGPNKTQQQNLIHHG